jgi:hypothetical protein
MDSTTVFCSIAPKHPRSNKVDLASHIRNGNFGESAIPLRGKPNDKN